MSRDPAHHIGFGPGGFERQNLTGDRGGVERFGFTGGPQAEIGQVGDDPQRAGMAGLRRDP
jgi:hypothetical protein